MKLSLILEAVDHMSRPLNQGRRSLDDFSGSAKGAGRSLNGIDRHMDKARRSARGLGDAGESMGHRIASGARRGVGALARLERRMQISRATMTKLAVAGAGMLGGAIRGGAMAAGAVGGAAAVGSLYKIVSAGMQAENFKTQLVGLESGNAAAAKKDLDWIKGFAADTPYDLAQVTEAFINARMAGINPMNGALMTLSDSAAGLNKTFDDAIGMLADAKTEQYERMREFGITPSQKDGKVMLQYVDRLGRSMVKTVNKAGDEVERATLDILNEKFGGGGAALAKTTMGKWNALTDRLSQQAVKVWDSGFGDAVKHQLDRATKAFENAEKSGSMDHWSNKASRALAGVVNTLGDADWDGFARDVSGVGQSLKDLYDIASKASEMLGSVRKGLAGAEVESRNYAGMLGQLEYYNGGLRYHLPEWTKPKASPPPVSSRNPTLQRLDRLPVPLAEGNAGARAARPAPTSRTRAAPATPPSRQPKAEVTVHVKTDPGSTARVTKIRSQDIIWEVNTGRAMVGRA